MRPRQFEARRGGASFACLEPMRVASLPLLALFASLVACGGKQAVAPGDASADALADAPSDAQMPSPPSPASYDQSCAVDTDCVLVTTPRACDAVVCGCQDAAIDAKDLSRWQSDVTAWKNACLASVPQQPCGDLCLQTKAYCAAGRCEVRDCLDPSCSADAGTDAVADAPSDAGACFTDVVTAPYEACRVDADCVVRHHQTDCCGTELVVGVAASMASPYDDCEHAWATHFPLCDCATQPLKTEDGNVVTDPAAIAVHCVDPNAAGEGVCKTSTP